VQSDATRFHVDSIAGEHLIVDLDRWWLLTTLLKIDLLEKLDRWPVKQ